MLLLLRRLQKRPALIDWYSPGGAHHDCRVMKIPSKTKYMAAVTRIVHCRKHLALAECPYMIGKISHRQVEGISKPKAGEMPGKVTDEQKHDRYARCVRLT